MAENPTDRPDGVSQEKKKSQTPLAAAVSHSPVVFYTAGWGSGAGLRFVSDNIENVTGDTAETVLSTPRYWRRRMHPDDLAKYAAQTTSLTPGDRTTVRYRLQAADGTYRWFRDEVRRVAGEDEDGSSDEIVGCLVDVTAEVDMLAEYGEMKSIHSAIFDTAPFAIIAIDDHGLILEFNRTAERMFGFRQDDMVGKSLSDTIIPERHREPHDRSLRRLRESGGIMTNNRRLEVEALRADGSLFPVSIVVTQAIWGKRSVFVSVITDLSEQVKAAQERRRQDELLRDAVESLSEGFAIYDADDRLTMCNERYRDLHKTAADILVPGVTWGELMLSEAKRGLYAGAIGREEDWVQDRLAARQSFRSRFVYEQTDGRWIFGSNRRTRQGGFVVTLNDVTELKERERELRQARELLEDAIESLSEGFALWDADDRLVMCNQTYREKNEKCIDILQPGVQWLDFIRAGAERGQYADAIGRIDEWVERSIEDRKALRTNHEYEISNDRWCIGANRRTRHGGIVVTRIDITERRKMEKALEESEAFNRRVLDSCPVAVEMIRAQTGEIIYASPASQALFGRDPVNGTQFACDAFVVRDDYDRYLTTLTDRGRVDDMTVELKRSDGDRFWASLSARLVDYQGEGCIVSTIFDLTERRATESELERQRNALHQSEKMTALGSLLAGVAHELNNPLTVVIGRAMILEETLAETPHVSAVEKLRGAAERCSKIVQTFLSMARQSEPTRELERIDRIVGTALEIVGYGLRTDSIDVRLDLDEDLPEIAADASQLIQVFTNIFVNAQQALANRPHPRWIRVSGAFDPREKSLIVEVEDNGPGIPEEIRNRIFDPFFTTRQTEQGTGLGLSVSLGLIRAHHGSIDVRTGDSGGTLFVIRLPVDRPHSARQFKQDEEAPEAANGSILIVEDEEEIAHMLAEFLEPLGHQVIFAETGRVALNRLKDHRFDLVLTDLRMPDLDGQQFYEELRNRDPDLASKTVFVTGDTLSGNFESFLAETGRPVIEKPFTPREIREIVSTELRRGA